MQIISIIKYSHVILLYNYKKATVFVGLSFHASTKQHIDMIFCIEIVGVLGIDSLIFNMENHSLALVRNKCTFVTLNQSKRINLPKSC